MTRINQPLNIRIESGGDDPEWYDALVRLRFNSQLPFEASIWFHSECTWVLSLDLLRNANNGTKCGEGDIFFDSYPGDPDFVLMRLWNGAAGAIILLDRNEINTFISAVDKVSVTDNVESELDKTLSEILRGAAS